MNLWTGFHLLTKWSSLNYVVDCAALIRMIVAEPKSGHIFLNRSTRIRSIKMFEISAIENLAGVVS